MSWKSRVGLGHIAVVGTVPPDVFAVVMAAGILSIAAADHEYRALATILGLLASAMFALLLVVAVVRVTIGPSGNWARRRDPDVALRMFTFVAASAVLATRWGAHRVIASTLTALGLVAWLVLVPLALRDVQSRTRSNLLDHVHGAWLLATVATEGVTITAADMSARTGTAALTALAAIVMAGGVLVYPLVAGAIVARTVSAKRHSDTLSPDMWILMGALAITSLAADHVLAAVVGEDTIGWLAEGLPPLACAMWIAATAWIPLLLYVEIWEVETRAGALRYQRVWWAAVFPLGMYAAATDATSTHLHIRWLSAVSVGAFWVAAAVWSVVGLGLARRTVGAARRP
ncbi:tellurite resistance/C4-dicarboxylate transporter family protein [Antrihabitans cavernicola]|uniref:C4-dicarboxylate ABC transporter n=1 Tax=Antrihabitans cavernicola TaxID=2495913 RepID=A0A5A7S3L3_9NOCA|nr:tellurite resistance/C4-dicarboxylate transporter family protein [Spelaeibacter cavernicola]KAA0016340.1 C4-dicarboxylate ABC transporter [Spelaeibacter cavernicola]